jgi:ankyrin repeat protein
MAVEGGYLNIVEYLVKECKFDVNEADKLGVFPLYVSCYNGNTSITKFLIDQGANVLIKGQKQSNCLHASTERGFLDIVKLLVSKEPKLMFEKDEEGNTPLHVAVAWSHMYIISHLFELGGKPLVDVKNNDGQNAIEYSYEEN